MASFIYFYSKFTEEFLLLTAAGTFALLAFYCYTWVVKKRRLGAARNQVPAGMVKIYLNQLINEAQFVRTQLFGLAGGAAPNLESFAAHFQANPSSEAHHHAPASTETSSSAAPIPSDLLDRLKALEKQLADKESMVININVEKSKLLEELENVKQNQKVTGALPAASGNQDDLVHKIKALEERLEEYALFEDDLANLKRLQQENTQLKKRIEETQGGESKVREAPRVETGLLDPAAVEALLSGVSAVPPTPAEDPAPAIVPVDAAPLEPVTPIAKAKPAAPNDEFEKLVDSVEGSLAKAEEPQPLSVVTPPLAAAPSASSSVPAQAAAPAESTASASTAEKSDEELLKEFENLLNS
jgi:hypothetical protein